MTEASNLRNELVEYIPWKNKSNTRMHSSRMRTSRSLTVCCSLLPGVGGVGLGGVGVLPGPGGGSPWSGGGGREGSAWSRGGSLETPPVDRITDTCKNITLATTSLRPVIKYENYKKQECRMHSSRMRTARSLTVSRGMQTLDADPPDADPLVM